jgi:HK97 family phage prohead protease
MNLEIRSGLALRAASQGRLVGLAAVFDKPSQDLGGFVEVIRPGAFRRSLVDADYVRALYNHDDAQVLGRVGAGTLRLQETHEGLSFELDLPPTGYGKDLAVLVERGDVSGCSIGFRVRDGGERWTMDTPALRELLDLELVEITVTGNPAYRDTTVALRSYGAARDDHDGRPLYMWLETCR